MARLTRQEILKEDRFMVVVDRFHRFFTNNRSEILRGLSAFGVVAVFAAGYFYYSAKQGGAVQRGVGEGSVNLPCTCQRNWRCRIYQYTNFRLFCNLDSKV